MIDEFLRYSVVNVLESKKPVLILEIIVFGWFMRFGTSVSNLHDSGEKINNDLILLLMKRKLLK